MASDECLCCLYLHLIYNSYCKNDNPYTPIMMNGLVQFIRLEDFIKQKWVNPLYTGELFHCDMLEKSICHIRGAGSIL